MPKPKDPTLQEKLRQWAEKNPDRWFTAEYKDIAIETGVSLSTVYRYLPLIVGRVGNILPSEVKAKRKVYFGESSRERKLSDENIAEIQRLYAEGHEDSDIAFLTGYSLSEVEKHRPKKQPPEKATQDTE